MNKKYKTEQEIFWAGEFGNEYIERNSSGKIIASNIALFSKILSRTRGVESVLEFGANIGLNLHAIKQLNPSIKLSAIEINGEALEKLEQIGDLEIYHQSILEKIPDLKADFVLIKGVLIHINPSFLDDVYEKLYESSLHYICVSEYYNPFPVEVTYRGHESRLFKRDFAGEILDRYPDLKLVDYGFVYHRDPIFPADDFTWFLLEKPI